MSTVASVVLWLSLAGVVAFLAFSKKGRGIGKRFHSLVQPYEDTQAADVPAGGRSPRGGTVLYSMEELSIEPPTCTSSSCSTGIRRPHFRSAFRRPTPAKTTVLPTSAARWSPARSVKRGT